jgi:hypothetical protein
MTELLPEFSSLPVRGVFDGELVAFGNDGKPSFERICRRILQRRPERAGGATCVRPLTLDTYAHVLLDEGR